MRLEDGNEHVIINMLSVMSFKEQKQKLWLDREITLKELQDAIEAMAVNKSPGPDDITKKHDFSSWAVS